MGICYSSLRSYIVLICRFFFYSYQRRKKILKCIFKIKRLVLRFSKGWKGLLNTLSIIRTWVNPTTGVTVATHVPSSVQSLSHIRLFVTPWTAAYQASLSITISWSLLKLMSTESVIPSNHLTHCYPLLLLPSVFPIIRKWSYTHVPYQECSYTQTKKI